MVHHQSKVACKKYQQLRGHSSECSYILINVSLHRDLEDGKIIFSRDTLACDDAWPHQAWLQELTASSLTYNYTSNPKWKWTEFDTKHKSKQVSVRVQTYTHAYTQQQCATEKCSLHHKKAWRKQPAAYKSSPWKEHVLRLTLIIIINVLYIKHKILSAETILSAYTHTHTRMHLSLIHIWRCRRWP